MSSMYDWSLIAANNASSDSSINWTEGQLPGTVNGSAKAMMTRDAELLGDIGGALTAGGTADALTVTANSAFTAYANGLILALRIATDNTGAATLNVNGIGAKSIRKMVAAGESALTGAELQATGIYLLMYSTALNAASGGWLLLNPTIDVSNLVTLTGTQTLSNKTLTSPTINTPTIATPTITGLDASTTAKGIIEQATDAETQTGTDTARSVSPANLTAKEASVANYRANTADRILTTDIVWSSAAEVTLTDAVTIAVDMSAFINAVVTLGGNRTLGNPTSEKVGQSGLIRIVQDGTGSRTLAYGTDWEFAGGSAPVLTTTAGANDLLFYHVIAADRVFANLVKAVS